MVRFEDLSALLKPPNDICISLNVPLKQQV